MTHIQGLVYARLLLPQRQTPNVLKSTLRKGIYYVQGLHPKICLHFRTWTCCWIVHVVFVAFLRAVIATFQSNLLATCWLYF